MFGTKRMKLSQLEMGWLAVAGALVATTGLLLSVNSSGGSNIVRIDSGARSQLAEASAALTTGGYKPGQVAFWTGSNTIAGDSSFTWNNTSKKLKALVLDSAAITSPRAITLYPGGSGTDQLVEIIGRVRAYGTGINEGLSTIEIRGGGLQFQNGPYVARPACFSGNRGLFWFPTAPTSSKGGDSVSVCVNAGNNVLVWRTLPLEVEQGGGFSGGGL